MYYNFSYVFSISLEIKTPSNRQVKNSQQRLKSREWGCPIDNWPKLAEGPPRATKNVQIVTVVCFDLE